MTPAHQQPSKQDLLEAIARAKAKIAAANAAKKADQLSTPVGTVQGAVQEFLHGHKQQQSEASSSSSSVESALRITTGIEYNDEQKDAIARAVAGSSFCLIGAAGTGKTTTLRGALQAILASNRIPPIEVGTKYLRKGASGIALVSYTRRAVRNIAKQMPLELRPQCMTIHKLLEFEPTQVIITDGEGNERESMRFEPRYNRYNKLPRALQCIIIDESSMVSLELFQQLLDALSDVGGTQFIFLGDLNQLPPVYGQAVLAAKLIELPTVELIRVYRQALESPIIDLALAIKSGDITPNKRHEFISISKVTEFCTSRGKVTLHPWKKKLDVEDGLFMMQSQLKKWIKEGFISFEDDIILCPWNKSFGTVELNKTIADTLAKLRGATVYEVIAGFEKHYYSVGDRVMVDKQDAEIIEIARNPRYFGKTPQPESVDLDYWGVNRDPGAINTISLSNDDIDAILDAAASMDIEDRTHDASHIITVRFLDTPDVTEKITKASEVNAMDLAYAMTVHKAQGSEWRRVFFLTHDCHAAMLSRELVYTAITRASEELYIVMDPSMLKKAAARPRIKGDTLAEKLEFIKSRMGEKMEQDR